MGLLHYSATASDLPELPDFRQLFIADLQELSKYSHLLVEAKAALTKLKDSTKQSLKLPSRMSFEEVLKTTVIEMDLSTAQGEVEKNQEMVNLALEKVKRMLSEVAKEKLKSREAYVTVEEHSTQHWTLYSLFGQYQVLRTETSVEIPSRIAEIFKQAGGPMGMIMS